MGIKWVRRWAGGRVSERRDGRLVWHLERQVEKTRHRFMLDVETERSALAELALFDRNPAEYVRSRDPRQSSRVTVDADRVEAFDAHLESQKLTIKYRNNVSAYLNDWLLAIDGRPFAALRLADLHEILDKAKTARKHRIIALKSYCSWLRETGALSRTEDPTLDLKVPPPVAEKSVREKGYPMAHVAAVYRHIAEQDVRDIIRVRAATGMHETELGRIMRGKAIVREIHDPCGIAAVVRFGHKSGRQHLQSIDAGSLAAVRRLREGYLARKIAYEERGRPMPVDAIDNARLQDRLREAAARAVAAKATKLEEFAPGELRHSFVTWREHGKLVRPVEGGVGLHEVAELIGHQSARTTSRYYDGLAVPPMMVLPLALNHRDDPPIPAREQGGRPEAAPGESDAAAPASRPPSAGA